MKKIIVAVMAFALMTGYAYAADWNFYGQAAVYTVWYDVDKIEDPTVKDPDTQFAEGLYACSKIGATVKVSDELTGAFEYGSDGGNADVRLLYGEWNFGAGTLTVGKAYTPINITYSNQFAAGTDEDLGLGGYGDFDQSRTPEIMLTFGGFSVAFIAPETNAYSGYVYGSGTGFVPTTSAADTQAIMPMIAVGYKATFDMGEVVIGGAYNTFEINDDEDIDSFGIGLGANLNFGAFGFFGTFVWGENIANLGTSTSSQFTGTPYYNGTDVFDCESIGGTIGATFTVNEMFSLEAGYGYIYDEYDISGTDLTSIAQSYYLQAVITLAPGVTVTPEIGVIDQREVYEDESVYFGAGWSIAF